MTTSGSGSAGTTGSAIGVSNTGTVFFSGVASGIDTQSLITNAVNAKLLAKTQYTDQISSNTAKITAYQTLTTQATALQTALANLSSSTLGTTANPFSSTQATYTTSDGSNASNVLTATTAAGAQAGTYNIVVSQLAAAFSATSDTQTSSTAALGYTGTFDIGEAGKTSSTITVSSTSTLSDIRDQINATSATTGVQADILQQANGQYKLVISGNDTNQAVNISNVTGDDVMTNLGVTKAASITATNPTGYANITQAQQPAKLTLNGSAVTSDTNTVSNVLTGFSLTLTSAAPSTTVTVSVGNNVSGVVTAVQAVVTAYNTLINTIAANKLIDADGTVDTNAVLYGDTINTDLSHSLPQLLSASYGGGIFNGIGSLGITIDDNNNLSVDTASLTLDLTNNFSDVESMFATNGSTTGLADTLNSQLDIYTNTSTGLIASTISTLQTQNADDTTKADDIQTAADQYQTQLISRYATMETQIEQSNLLKQQITAILTGSTASSTS